MRFLLSSLLLLALAAGPTTRPARAAQTAEPGNSLQRLTAEFDALDNNAARGSRRDLWLALEEKFAALAAKSKGGTRAGAAFYRARAREELGRRSFLPSDHRQAASLFAAAAAAHPGDAIAPESLYRQANILAHRLGDGAAALSVLERLIKNHPKSGKIPEARKLLARLQADPAAPAGGSATGSGRSSVTLKGISWESRGQRAVITLELDRGAKVEHSFSPPDPAKKTPGRLYLDILGAMPSGTIKSGLSPNKLVVSRIRTGKTDTGTRVTLECNELQCYLVSSPKGAPQIIRVEVSRKDDIRGGVSVRDAAGGGGARSAGRAAGPGASVMEQLGLTVQTIMLDAGHGGNDPGARAAGITEKHFTLSMTRRVGALLRKQGFTVLYSRGSDAYLSLQARPELANSKKADLFISIHVNANAKAEIRGLETYYLDEAKTQDAATVAARENGVSTRNISDLQFILTDFTLSSKVRESHHLAECVHSGILQRLRAAKFAAPDNGVRSAPFYVLTGARMPAILVEFGYITNRHDAANLKSEAYLQRQAEGLVQGILRYKAELAKTVPRSR